MLAAAGGPNIHPHKFSSPEDRARWDRDMANYNKDFKAVEKFFSDIRAGRLSADEQARRGFSFFAIQGPWYTVGWQMAVVIEQAYGRETLISSMCDRRKLFATYNQAATKYNATSNPQLPLWSTTLVDALR
jgi:hypothetical protein